MTTHFKTLSSAALLIFSAACAHASDAYVNATIGGVIAPGVYGRIDIGTAPPPPVIYRQPVIISRPAVVVQQQPLYLYVPPGHAKKWSKHCAKYNACGQPVYFVNVNSRGEYVGQNREQEDRRRGGDDEKGNGKGHGKGHGKDH